MIVSAVLAGTVSRIGVLALLVALDSMGMLGRNVVIILLAVYGTVELLARMSESGIEGFIGKPRKESIAIALTRKAISSLAVILLYPSIAVFVVTIVLLVHGYTGYAVALSMAGMVLTIWWRDVASSICVRASLTGQVYRASIVVPATVILLVLLSSSNEDSWVIAALYTGYLLSSLIIYLTLRITGLLSSKGISRPVIGRPDPSSLISSLKYVVALPLVPLGGNGVILLGLVLFDFAAKLSTLLQVRWSLSRLLVFVSLVPGIVGGDLLSTVYLAGLSLFGFYGIGYQSPLRCILCI